MKFKKSKTFNRNRKLFSICINKRSAIQLSMSFLVMFIIAVVVFTFSVLFLKDFFVATTKIKATLDEQAKVDIERMLAADSRVAIPIDKRETKPGKAVVFGIGIKNTLKNAYFGVRVEQSGSVKSGSYINYAGYPGSIYCNNNNECYDNYIGGPGSRKKVSIIGITNRGDITLKTNSEGIISMLVQPLNGAPVGEYIYNVRVCYSETAPVPHTVGGCVLYDNQIHRLHVIVK